MSHLLNSGQIAGLSYYLEKALADPHVGITAENFSKFIRDYFEPKITQPKEGKVLLTDAQIKALEDAMACMSSSDIIAQQVHTAYSITTKGAVKWSDERRALNSLSIDTVARAIYIGYERPTTPIEDVQNYYNGLKAKTNNDDLYYVQMGAIESTLRLLGIRIEGIPE